MIARLIIDNRVRVLASELTPAAVERLKTAFEHENGHRAALERMNIPTYGEPRTIVTWECCSPAPGERWCPRKRNYRQQDLHLSFPRGALGRVRRCLAEEGVDWTIEDRRTTGRQLDVALPDPTVTLRDYQDEMVQAMLNRENCIIRGGTGCGKTEAALAFFQRVDVRGLVIVWRRKLFDQWVKRIAKTFGVNKRLVGIIRGKVRRIGAVTVAMQQTLSRMSPEEMAEISSEFGAVVADEIHKFAAPTMFDAIDPFLAKWRIGVSDDERRKDRKEFLIYDLCGEVAYEVTREELLERGHIVDVEVRIVPTEFRADWYGIADEEDPDLEVDFGRLLEEMRADQDRNDLLVSRIVEEARADNVVLCMTRRREHTLLLEAAVSGYGVRTGLMIGGDDYSTAFDKTAAEIEKGKCKAAFGTIDSIGTGIDMPTAKVAAVGSPLLGNKQLARQVWGRFCRKVEHLGGGRMIVLWDQHVYPGHLANALAWFPSVVVWDGTAWANGRKFLKEWKRVQSSLGAA